MGGRVAFNVGVFASRIYTMGVFVIELRFDSTFESS